MRIFEGEDDGQGERDIQSRLSTDWTKNQSGQTISKSLISDQQCLLDPLRWTFAR